MQHTLERKNLFAGVLVRFLVVLAAGKEQKRPYLIRTVRSTMIVRRLLFFWGGCEVGVLHGASFAVFVFRDAFFGSLLLRLEVSA